MHQSTSEESVMYCANPSVLEQAFWACMTYMHTLGCSWQGLHTIRFNNSMSMMLLNCRRAVGERTLAGSISDHALMQVHSRAFASRALAYCTAVMSRLHSISTAWTADRSVKLMLEASGT